MQGEASDYWWHVEDDDALWQLVEARVTAMNDPQLPETAAAQLREALPEVLARIHAENAVRYVTEGDEGAARLHVGLARAHLPAERLAGVLETALQPAVGRLEAFAALARRPTGVIEPLCAVLKAASPDLALLAAVDGPDGAPHLHGHQTRLLAEAVLGGLVAAQETCASRRPPILVPGGSESANIRVIRGKECRSSLKGVSCAECFRG